MAVVISAAALTLALAALAVLPNRGRAPAWTPAPATRPLVTHTPAPSSSPTVMPTRQPPAATLAPADEQKTIVITEEDIARAVEGATAGQEGLIVEGLQVRFADGKMQLTTDRLEYGIVQLSHLDLVGRLEASEGRLQLRPESIEPGGLAGAMIPVMVNEALVQYAAEWYVEDVQVGDGYISLRLR
jgi:hypothetical protein